jgi:predicted metal-dependent HD superfamily phosphohydrolase
MRAFSSCGVLAAAPWSSIVSEVGGASAGNRIGAAERVARRWNALAQHRCCPGPASAAVLDELLCAYREPHRHYHTLDHIADLLMLLDRHIEPGVDREALTLAILFHDIAYDPTRHDNEEASAKLATERLTTLGFPVELVTKVDRCIMTTRHGVDAAAVKDADLALLLDLDLSILAGPPEVYRTYALAVRREYAHVPDALYGPGRRRVLEGFLAREHIYLTRRLRTLWEERARANLAAEAAGLA